MTAVESPKASIVFDGTGEGDERFPLYLREGDNKYRQAFASIDLKTGDVDASIGGFDETSNSIDCSTCDFYLHNGVYCFEIRPDLMRCEIFEILEDALPLFQQILDGDHDAADEIAKTFERKDLFVQGRWIIDGYSFGEWVAADPYPGENQSIDDFASELLKTDGQDGIAYYGNHYDDEYAIKESLLDLWEKELESEHGELPEHVAGMLLEEHGWKLSEEETKRLEVMAGLSGEDE